MEHRFRLLLRRTRNTSNVKHRHMLGESWMRDHRVNQGANRPPSSNIPTSSDAVHGTQLSDTERCQKDARLPLAYASVAIGGVSCVQLIAAIERQIRHRYRCENSSKAHQLPTHSIWGWSSTKSYACIKVRNHIRPEIPGNSAQGNLEMMISLDERSWKRQDAPRLKSPGTPNIF